MNSKLWFLTKMSLRKKIKTKWFLIANIIFLIVIAGLINIDNIIKFFGGDFNETTEILVIDNASLYDEFVNNYDVSSNYFSDYDKANIVLYDKTYDEALEEVKEDDKVLIVIDLDDDNYLTAKVVSNKSLGTISDTLIHTTLNAVRSELVLRDYNITYDMYLNVNVPVEVENVVLDDNNIEDNVIVSTVMEIITLPLFMLILFLVQMIGAEVNEEKSTKSMEIIISNVSPQTHFISKVISANTFVIIQGLLLIIYAVIGVGIRFILCGGDLFGGVGGEVGAILDAFSVDTIVNSLVIMLPILIVILLLTFFAYSLLAGILASMTTNLEDFQQLQTPIMIVLLVGFYLSTMAGIFKGSIFIKIMSYIPLISSLLSPTLYVMGDVGIFDLCISVLFLVLLIYILIKYGLKIYKAGILNYSGVGLWKKMLKALKER